MKFGHELGRSDQDDLRALYKQLKKSLKIFEPADEGSTMAEAGSSDESDGERAAPPPAQQQQQQQEQHVQQQQQAQQLQGLGEAGAGAPAGPFGAAPVPPGPAEQQAGAAPARHDAAQEARFTALVERCVQQLNDDFLSREEMLVIKADLAQSAAYFASSREELSAAYTSTVNLHGELVLLCHWSMCAYTGIVKILKKHHKRTGQRVQSAMLATLLSQPFCSLEEVRGMVRAAEAQMQALASRLGLAPAAAPAAGAAAAAAVRDPSMQQPVVPKGMGVGGGGGGAGGGGGPLLGTGSSGSGGSGSSAPAQPAQQGRAPAQPQAEVPLVATAAGATAAGAADGPAAAAAAARPALKRDRSKHFHRGDHSGNATPCKRREAVAMDADTTFPAACGDGRGAAARRHGASHGSSGGDSGMASGMATSPGGSASGGSAGAGVASGGAGAGGGAKQGTIMQRTKAALQLWKTLRTNASTPSTVLCPPADQAPLQLQQQPPGGQ
ncbi:SPX domain-containing 1-like [Micractinium conductrix]|uniref:SPX domain-containing 1-like n=1 Tax=Micractinium conductrix TaxID=554055 RepID=A0A2P6VNR3_9CHLO|nr:SPX domain-containing 1-like [Micractinium conductrix]|eukprot:PSC75736.1 SPX domain-containing 1-like [Micractinium conductrix]